MSGTYKMVVGLDPEWRARDAIGLALALAAAPGSELHIVHVVEPTRVYWPLGPIISSEEAREYADKVIEAIPEQLPENVRTHVRLGHPVRELLDFCTEIDADLLILGRHHEGRLDPLIGSTAQKIVRTSKTPVLVHKAASTRVPKRLLVAVDLSEPSTLALREAVEWATRWGGTLHVLYVFEPPEFAYGAGEKFYPTVAIDEVRRGEYERLDKLIAETDFKGVEHDVIKAEGDPRTEILRVGDEKDAEVIMMGTHGRTGLERIFLGSVAEYVVRRGARSVLVAPRPDHSAS